LLLGASLLASVTDTTSMQCKLRPSTELLSEVVLPTSCGSSCDQASVFAFRHQKSPKDLSFQIPPVCTLPSCTRTTETSITVEQQAVARSNGSALACSIESKA